MSGRVRCGDATWRALDSRALHRQLKPAGMVYQAALRAELTARLGVSWTPVDRHGQAEVDGVPAGLRRLYSRRRAAVEARAGERIARAEADLERALTPEERRRAYEIAVLETRQAKHRGPEADVGLHDRWRAEAEAAGFGPASWLPDTVGHGVHEAPGIDQVVADRRLAHRSGITGDTLHGMAEASIRELRNHGGEVIDRVAAGERVTITRDGKAVAELRPLPRPRATAAALIERFRKLPPVDPSRFRVDVDEVVDQSL